MRLSFATLGCLALAAVATVDVLAGEKVLKAELIRLGWFLEKTHDVEVLGNELEVRNSDLIPQVKPLCTALAEVYFTDRYPGFELEEANWPDFRGQLAEVTRLLETIKTRVTGTGGTAGPAGSHS